MRVLLEVIATSPDDCRNAEAAGADRIELCSALALGGLTPTLGLLIEARRLTRLPIMAMLRPRPGGFCYSESEFAAMRRDAALLLEHGADGIVFGCLLTSGAIHATRTQALVQVAHNRQPVAPAVFHRAFDLTPDLPAALDTLIGLGVTRVLTSGGAPDALTGASAIAALITQAQGRIEVLPGAGVTATNVAALLARTQATQVHASLSGETVDPSASQATAHAAVRMGAADQAPDTIVRVLDAGKVAAMRRVLDAL